MNDNLHENNLSENLNIYKYYCLTKENIEYRLVIEKGKTEILIKYQKYKIILNNNDLSKLTKLIINTLDEAYNFIVNLFENHKVAIEDINLNKYIKLLLKIEEGRFFEIILVYNKDNNNSFNKITVSNNSYAKFAIDYLKYIMIYITLYIQMKINL